MVTNNNNSVTGSSNNVSTEVEPLGDVELFKSAHQNAFYVRNRDYAQAVLNDRGYKSPYEIVDLRIQDNAVCGRIIKHVAGGIELALTLKFSGESVRITIDEIESKRYNEVDTWVFAKPAEYQAPSCSAKPHPEEEVFKFGENEVAVHKNPLRFTIRRRGQDQLVINGRQLMNFEHRRSQDAKNQLGKHEVEIDMWQESFKGHDDIKANGPESVAMDFEFVEYKHVYGIPEHATGLSLPQLDEPYRLFNLDAFEYDVDSAKALYGAIPLMQAHKRGSSIALFWVNASDTYVALDRKQSVHSHWVSESGLLDFVVFLGDRPQDIARSYGGLTGFAQLPQLWSLGYHQCRWNYFTQEEVEDLAKEFDERDIPLDCVWLDIEYSDKKQYFNWDHESFPDPKAMCEVLGEKKRKLVAIVDPHIKAIETNDLYAEIKKKDVAIVDKDGKIFEGRCWPGQSIWIDSLNPEGRDVWKNHHETFVDEADNVFIWNDMNEPSVFDGAENTMDKSAKHHGGWEHREVHNLYGKAYVKGTFDALTHRYPDQRPFVLTRSFFAGSQRYGAAWTGDNMCKWSHLKVSLPMIMSANISGVAQIGADVAGFFGHPSDELMTRWFQAGAFYPFCRGHANIDCKRREPWVRGEPYTSIIRNALKTRYRLLPTLYTAFYHASVSGAPVMKPMVYAFPENEEVYDMDDQFFVGDSGLLIKPVVEEGQREVDLYLADDEFYYDYATGYQLSGVGYHKTEMPLEKIPVFMRGGHIHARKDTPRASSELMKEDPYTLVVAASRSGKALGDLYVDDGVTHEHKQGEFLLCNFELSEGKLRGTSTGSNKFASLRIKQVEFIGPDVSTVKVTQGGEAAIVKVVNGKAAINVSIGSEWEIDLS
ncbi:glucosidase 2 subunit alpha [Trichomonascus vanleenenianus]|uniref:glycoside hydrolase family 31 protein n=1 Tax=Trichomonascus vanleenenianus TaxID=2268995 RepID=UPI003ECA7463